MMTKLNLMKSTLVAACAALFSFSLSAQVVKNDRLLSFEQPELPAGLSATKATLGISANIIKTVRTVYAGHLNPALY